MKSPLILSLLTLNSSLLTLSAAVPLEWTVETSRASLAKFDEFAGATYDLEATLQSKGRPLEVVGDPHLYWQTNGMGTFYWSAPATVSGNVLRATWTPSMETGARVYNCFIGITGTVYNAAFQLSLRPSPGAIPNVLPLPVPVIDFAKIRVLNPPWTPGGGGGVDTNAVIDIIHETVAGAARPLPPYLHAIDLDDSYASEAAWYYAQPQDYGSCSARRLGGVLERNYDWKFNGMAEFVVRMAAGSGRYASVGVANCGTNLTEDIVTSGRPSRYYKCLPGRTVDGINENGVVAEINVVDGPVTNGWHTTGDLHPLAAVRWALDHATNAEHAATYLAANIRFPEGWRQNFHYMIADSSETWFVEDGHAAPYRFDEETSPRAVLTNYKVVHGMGWPSTWWYLPYFTHGDGSERLELLIGGGSITNVWYTRCYDRSTNPPWLSEFGDNYEYWAAALNAWALKPKEAHRGETFNGLTWWQAVHTSVYDISNRVLRVAVQETDDWYTFNVPSAGPDESTVREIAGVVVAPVASSVSNLTSSVSGLQSTKLDGPTDPTLTISGKAADAKATGDALAGKVPWVEDIHGNLTAVTIGIRKDGSEVGDYSVAIGIGDEASGSVSFAIGRTTIANGNYSFAEGALTVSRGFASHASGCRARTLDGHSHSFAWQGVNNGAYYDSHGGGTFNLNPVGGLSGLWIGETNMVQHIANIAPHYTPSAADPAFSNAVLAVGIDTNVLTAVAASTNAVAQIGEFYAAFSDIGLTPTQGGMTLAGLLAALVAAVTWLKKVLGKVSDNSGKPTDQFATNLLEKQVANVKANTVSLAAAYSETATYAVGDAVTHDGKLYKCAVAITTAEAWTSAHWTETTVATLWNNADTTYYGGQN